MNFDSLIKMMNDEYNLYKSLQTLFDAKKTTLLKNDLQTLSIIDNKIMKLLHIIQNRPKRESFTNLIINYPTKKSELEKYQKEFKKILNNINLLNQETFELSKQGIKLADTKLKMMIRAGSQSQSYSKYGNFEQNAISTVVQEV